MDSAAGRTEIVRQWMFTYYVFVCFLYAGAAIFLFQQRSTGGLLLCMALGWIAVVGVHHEIASSPSALQAEMAKAYGSSVNWASVVQLLGIALVLALPRGFYVLFTLLRKLLTH